MNRVSSLCLLLLAVVSNQAYAGFDHELPLDQNGVWTPSEIGAQRGFEPLTHALRNTVSLFRRPKSASEERI